MISQFWGEGEYPLLELCNSLNNNNNLENVPRLIYRKDNNILASKNSFSKYLDFKKPLYPNYDDIIELSKSKKYIQTDQIVLPVEGSRGCSWLRCKFCITSKGFHHKSKTPELIVNEIEERINLTGITKFWFTDNDALVTIERFDLLLVLIIELSARKNLEFTFFADILHYNLNSSIIKKMSIAGFKHVQIGFEALSDSILMKMGKKTSFSDNILFLKFAIKYKIIVEGLNIVEDIPDETEDDIFDCIENLHFLRFFLSKNKIVFRFGTFYLGRRCKYFDYFDDKGLDMMSYNLFESFLPKGFYDKTNCFDIFYFWKNGKKCKFQCN